MKLDFETIQLKEMDKVKLMNRTDRKYWFHRSQLPDLLESIKHDYYILNIDGESQLPYKTTYYDTGSDKMFVDHHKGKLNRFKIRRRTYVNSGISFLEVKFKSNIGRTIKTRITAEPESSDFTEAENQFLTEQTPFEVEELKASLLNQFTRLTMVHKGFKERCTIDLNIRFKNGIKEMRFDDLVIVEIKAEANSGISPLALILRNQRIKSSGFSKYCVGRSVLDTYLKRNAFKNKIRRIEKVMRSNELIKN
ncbi:polyphosphate polymerase domain-containing protein [Carboxylicivirga sp. N1Y90]|uniref:polyphosphate polymerase domain-containing protein n=1 Tax=Carboxylicivirga fragile TaxID=3417571 RepID=UPI003D32D3D1|nr:polyphosphate polymerase domain-containing protein [Marinilabiliaceae bacterium N1Y90]